MRLRGCWVALAVAGCVRSGGSSADDDPADATGGAAAPSDAEVATDEGADSSRTDPSDADVGADELCDVDAHCDADQRCVRGLCTAADAQIACCFELACRLALPEACDDPAPAPMCGDPNPCEHRCRTDDECRPGYRCRPLPGGDTGFCTRCDPPCGEPECRAHDACNRDEACVDGRCVRGACRDDDGEPDDARDEATLLMLVDGEYRSPEGAFAICPDDADWFQFDVPVAGSAISVLIEFEHAAEGDLDARLYDPTGALFAEAHDRDDDEGLSAIAAMRPPAGRWSVEVYPRAGSANTYGLAVRVEANACEPDAAEADDDPGMATPIEQPELEWSADRILCPNDEDWFVVRMGAGDGLSVRLLISEPDGSPELTFEIYGPGPPAVGVPPVFLPNERIRGGRDGDVVAFAAPPDNVAIQDGDYYIRAFGLGPEEVGGYTLTVAVDRRRELCQDDLAEANDAIRSAFDLTRVPGIILARDACGRLGLASGEHLVPGLWLCSGEEDWFSVAVSAGDSLATAIVRDDGAEGDALIEIHDALGPVGMPGRGNAPLVTASAHDLPRGTAYVVVTSLGDTQAQYSLRVRRDGAAEPFVCPGDALDAGDESPIAPIEYRDLWLCAADEDHYTFELAAPADFTVTLRFAAADGNLDVDVWREGHVVPLNLGELAGHGDGDGESVTRLDQPAARYRIVVHNLECSDVRYDLELEVMP